MSSSATVPESEEFGGALRRLREARAWSRPQLAMRLRQIDPQGNWTTDKITHLERGEVRHPPLRVIRLLSIVLGCEPSELVWPPPDDRGGASEVTRQYQLVPNDLVGRVLSVLPIAA